MHIPFSSGDFYLVPKSVIKRCAVRFTIKYSKSFTAEFSSYLLLLPKYGVLPVTYFYNYGAKQNVFNTTLILGTTDSSKTFRFLLPHL